MLQLRPTFSESWYRVKDLRPRLRAGAQVHRQHYRGDLYYVVRDPAGNQYHRLNDIAYRFTRSYQNNPYTNSQVLFGNGYTRASIYNTVGDWTRTVRMTGSSGGTEVTLDLVVIGVGHSSVPRGQRAHAGAG